MGVFVSQPFHADGIQLLRNSSFDIDESNTQCSKEELIDRIKGKQALMCTVNDTVDAEVIAAGEDLKVIANVAVGYSNIDIEAARKKGIVVTNTPGVLTHSVVEFVFAHIGALTRRVVESDAYIRASKFDSWSMDLMLGMELRTKTLGIIGFGAIGQALVPIAQAFGMNVLYTNRRGPIEQFKNSDVHHADLKSILQKSDVLVLLTPLTDETRHLIGKEELQQMKSSAFLINMARGPVVKESDLIEALVSGEIAGAGLDVFEFEPHVPNELIEMTSVVLTPHIGSATHEARSRMSVKAAENIVAVLSGKEAISPII